MKIFKERDLLNKEISGIKVLGFVPTMGSLHNGHIYLIKKAKLMSSKIIVSIFVNPKQFDSKLDFKKYPRNIKRDLHILRKLKVDYVYLPKYNQIYNFKTKNSIYKHPFSRKLCGKNRKIHFKGVLNVVNRFLEIIKPNYMFLGIKDFQQCFLIKHHIEKNNIKTKVIICKTIREKNGLACSSRNKNLTISEKAIASKVYHFLKNEKVLIRKKKLFKINLKKILEKILLLGIKKVDYISFLDIKKLNKPKNKNNIFNIFIAYYIGKIRLIDNI